MKKLTVIHLYASVVGIFCTLRDFYVTHHRNYIDVMMEKNTINNCPVLKKSIEDWHFSHPKLLSLPIDTEKQNYVRRNVKEAIFSIVIPTPLKTDLKMVAYSEDALISILDMDPSIANTSEFIEFIAGNKILQSSTPLAHRYGGHQFGYWAMQLGDGRAILLGEYLNRAGERWELQLKGAGKTPYSREADGRAVLRSSIREFLCSEAMFYLGIPTSRAAALIVSKDPVIRDQFYNGFPQMERAAVVLRLAQSWFRFGSLEILAYNKEIASLRKLLDFIINEHYPGLSIGDENKYIQLFSIIAHKTMELVVDWMRVGFSHGVLNTDNMSMLGITIDYGPFGFLEAYDSQFIPNSSDKEGRYSYGNQIEIAAWNLKQLSQTFMFLLKESEIQALVSIMQYMENYGQRRFRLAFLKKLGLTADLDAVSDHQLVMLLLQMMEKTGADFTLTFRQLGDVPICSLKDKDILRKHWALHRLSGHSNYNDFIDAYASRLEKEKGSDEERRKVMATTNPRYILRNWMAQSAIEKAEKDDFSEVQFLLKVLKTPFTENEEAEKSGYADPPPKWANTIRVSCSS